MAAPDITVAVATHDRPERLAALLDGLERQTLARERFEVVVCHDADQPRTDAVLAAHGAGDGRLRTVLEEQDPRNPALKRNRAWRAGGAPLVVFTDDDCRPEPGWLEALLAVARAEPGAIVQGATRPEPAERHLMVHPYARTLEVEPPDAWAQTCNILYPRDLLERVGGFDDVAFARCYGEDTDLFHRSVAEGGRLVAAPDAVVFHAVEPSSLGERLRWTWRWRHAIAILRRHPQVRRSLAMGLFWRETHLPFLVAVAALLAAAVTRRVSWLGFALPWIERRGVWYRSWQPRPVAAAVRDTAGHAVVDAAEVGTMVAASAQHRTLIL